MLKQGTY